MKTQRELSPEEKTIISQIVGREISKISYSHPDKQLDIKNIGDLMFVALRSLEKDGILSFIPERKFFLDKSYYLVNLERAKEVYNS